MPENKKEQTRVRYFKYAEGFNKIEQLFDEEVFKKAPVILLEVPNNGPAAAYYLIDQNEEEDYNEVGLLSLGKGYKVPKNAEKITAKEFKEMVA